MLYYCRDTLRGLGDCGEGEGKGRAELEGGKEWMWWQSGSDACRRCSLRPAFLVGRTLVQQILQQELQQVHLQLQLHPQPLSGDPRCPRWQSASDACRRSFRR